MDSTSDRNSIKSTDSKKNLGKKLSNSKILNGICNTAFTLEEKLQSKGYSNLRNSDDAKSSDEDTVNTNTSTVNSTINSPNIQDDNVISFSPKNEDKLNKELDDCANCEDFYKADKLDDKDFQTDNKHKKRNSTDLRAAVQNLSCSLNLLSNSPNSKCDSKCGNKCGNNKLPEYVQQISAASTISSSEYHSQKNHQNGHKHKVNGNNNLNGHLNGHSNCLHNHSSGELEQHNIEIPDATNQVRRSSIYSALKGVLLAFLSSIFFSLTTVIVKYVKTVDAGQMAIYRFTGMLLFVFPIVIDTKQNIFGPRRLRHWILLRGLAGASSLYLRYSTLHYLPISNATVIVLSMPVFVCIFGRIFLKEACGIFHVIALGVTLIGIAFTSKLDVILGGSDKDNQGISRQNELYGLISGLGATLVGSSAYILVRKVKELEYSVILFNFAWVALLESCVITYTIHDGIKVPENNITPWLLMALGILSFYGQMLLTRALQAEEAALVSVTRSASEVFFAFLFQIVIFQNMPTLFSIIGALLVTSAVMLTSVRKYVIDLPEEHLARRIFWFTLI